MKGGAGIVEVSGSQENLWEKFAAVTRLKHTKA